MILSELIPEINKLSAIDKIKLIRILAEELETTTSICPLEAGKTYDLPTPYNSFGAGSILMEALNKYNQQENNNAV